MDKKFSKKSTHACLYSGKGERGHFETYTSLYHIGYEGGKKRGEGGVLSKGYYLYFLQKHPTGKHIAT